MNLADELIDRVSRKRAAWAKIYSALDQEFEYRRPTQEELDRYMIITLADSYKKPKKDDDNG